MVAVIFSDEDAGEPRDDDFRPGEADDADEFLQALAVAPVCEGIQDVLRSGVFPAEEPDFVYAELCAGLACFNFANVRHGGPVLASIVVSAASATRAEDNSYIL